MTWKIHPSPLSQVQINSLVIQILLRKEFFVLISLHCLTILIMGKIILSSGSRDLSGNPSYMVVHAVFHVMTKVSYFVYFVKVSCQARSWSWAPPWLFGQPPSIDLTYKSSQTLQIPAWAEHSVLWEFQCGYKACARSLGKGVSGEVGNRPRGIKDNTVLGKTHTHTLGQLSSPSGKPTI